ncbi:hypothetical protein ['Cynodon dactylon' phytoplasma]|uniref:hypothetical protein n=1 Tax='Cynodon dactylon' phytoplasma TaxID=295320 RepID=UPI001265C809|nr:hypothetical protein ['Cynodon dactylon' phytoplasma]KAB8121849.1 hypothetical protein F1741_01175 ['Cynodon dactylon' phytoplasma]
MFKKNHLSLQEIVITSFLSALNIVFYISLFSVKKNSLFPLYVLKKVSYKLFLSDFFVLLSAIPFLFLPFYSRKSFSFLGSFISEAGCFFLRGSKYAYNPFVSFFYAICWGILPNIFFKNKKNFIKKKKNFFSIYFFLTIIIFFHFIFYTVFNILCANYLYLKDLSWKKNFDIIEFLFKRYLFIRFFLLFLYSFIITYLYIKLSSVILKYTSKYYQLN